MKLRSIAEDQIDLGLDERIRSLLCCCFPEAAQVFSRTRAWHGSGPAWTVIATDDPGVLIGHVGLVDRTIAIGACSLRVAGVQNVCVRPAFRGRGIADRLLEQAELTMRAESFDAGLLFCTEPLIQMYARCGWRPLGGVSITRVAEDRPAVPLPDGSLAMWLPAGRSEWPPGAVHLAGNDW